MYNGELPAKGQSAKTSSAYLIYKTKGLIKFQTLLITSIRLNS